MSAASIAHFAAPTPWRVRRVPAARRGDERVDSAEGIPYLWPLCRSPDLFSPFLNLRRAGAGRRLEHMSAQPCRSSCWPSSSDLSPHAPRPRRPRCRRCRRVPHRSRIDAQVRPVLEQRCVVCHGCYDAPCQLVLSSHTGLDARREQAGRLRHRPSDGGAADAAVRRRADHRGVARARLLPGYSATPRPRIRSLLTLMLELGRAHPFPPGEKLPASVGARHQPRPLLPAGGGVRHLCDRSIRSAACRTGWPRSATPSSRCWPAGSAKAHRRRPPPPPLAAATTAQVARWETFLNGDSLKQRITARYLYEHWFLAHLYFEDLPAGPFFRVVRSTTPPGVAVDEIATRRPYDAPGVEHFWYRLRPIDGAIVHKTHIVYPLSDAKMQRLSALFLEADWQPTRLPSYDVDEASNPFDQLRPDSRSLALPVPARRRAVLRHDVHPRAGVPRTGGGRRDRGSLLRRLSRPRSRPLGHRSDLPHRDEAVSEPARRAPEPPRAGRVLDPVRLRAAALPRPSREHYYDAVDPQRRGPTLDYIWDGDGAQYRTPSSPSSATSTTPRSCAASSARCRRPPGSWTSPSSSASTTTSSPATTSSAASPTKSRRVSTWTTCACSPRTSSSPSCRPISARRSAPRGTSARPTRSTTTSSTTCTPLDHGTQIPFTSGDVKAQLIEMILARNADGVGAAGSAQPLRRAALRSPGRLRGRAPRRGALCSR